MSLSIKYNNIPISGSEIIESINYSTNMDYANDVAINYYYTFTIAGYCLSDDNSSPTLSMQNIKNIFNSNGAKLELINKDNNQRVLLALDSKIKSINFNESSDNWAKTVPFSVEIDFNHLYLGSGIDSLSGDILSGKSDDPNLINKFSSPYLVDLSKYNIKTFDENFSMDINDADIYSQISLTNQIGATVSRITNNFFNISYTLSAVGKHDIYIESDEKRTLPAWETAKRFVHNRLVNQIDSMFFSFLSVSTSISPLNNIHAKTNNYGMIDLVDPLGGASSFGIFNETLNFDVSESEGSFSVQYNAIVKRNCPAYVSPNVGCSNYAIHTVNKTINRNFNANEQTNLQNQDISISVNGEIRGLVPGRGTDSLAPFVIANPGGPYKGTFLIKNNTPYDKNDYANQLLLSIFNTTAYDFSEEFKAALGVTPSTLVVNPYTILRPSRINLTRNYLNGTITYDAEYDSKYNCSTSHFEVNLTVDMPVPVIAEFTIPHNNIINSNNNIVCSSGYSVIQKLGTQTAKKINVSINGNAGFDIGKCCLGSEYDSSGQVSPSGTCDENNDEMDLLSLNYFSTQDFIIPSGVVIPIIGDNFILTNKQKTSTFPKGDFSISLEYICADVCEDYYFQED